ncbi:MAG: lytic murein transglycosylase [Acidimicrobiales bacterium]
MQFLPPTFEAWAVDGDADGTLDPHDVDDAVATAAAHLRSSAGEITDERAALRRYNASDTYVEEVLAWADRYASAPPLVVPDDAEVAALLAHPNVSIYADGRDDLAAGRVDGRVVAVLLALARDHTISITSLVTGQRHDSDCTGSNHRLGRAADIAVLDGAPVSARPRRSRS